MERTIVTKSQLSAECWVVTVGRGGVENQCLGLAERIGLPTRIFRLALTAFWNRLAPYSFGNPLHHLQSGSDRPAPPWPHLFIGCGRQSIPFARRARREGSFTVQCQDPRVPTHWFDLVVPPEHDKLKDENVFPILGSPNRITSERLGSARALFAELFAPLKAPRLAVLIGGPNRHYRFGEKEVTHIARTLRQLAREHGLMVTLSRRSTRKMRDILTAELNETGAYLWNESGENPYLGMLAWADAFLVTADSINMICEAGATGKPVHVLEVPGGNAKFERFHAAMVQRDVARRFRGTIEEWSYEPLNETGRAAAHIKSLLENSSASRDMNG